MVIYCLLSRALQKSSIRCGASLAQSDIKGLVESLTHSKMPVSVVLDFKGIDAVNASYARASVAWFVRCARAARDGVKTFETTIDPWAVRPLPIEKFFVARLSADIHEELDGLLRQPSFKLACLELREIPSDDARKPKLGRLLGHLDEQLYQCLIRLYAAGGRSTAAGLQQAFSDDGVQTTAWNNRLAALHERGLVDRSRDGRSWIYHTTTEEIQTHGISLATA